MNSHEASVELKPLFLLYPRLYMYSIVCNSIFTYKKEEQTIHHFNNLFYFLLAALVDWNQSWVEVAS